MKEELKERACGDDLVEKSKTLVACKRYSNDLEEAPAPGAKD